MSKQAKFVFGIFVLFVVAGIGAFGIFALSIDEAAQKNSEGVYFERGQISCDKDGCTVGTNWFPYN